MPGFLGAINKQEATHNFKKNNNDNLVVDFLKKNKFYLERRTINKFLNDKVFVETEKYIIITEGVILNKNKLMNTYFADSFSSAIIKMYKKNGEDFFSEFRGSFSGLFYDKQNDKWLIYTNFIGDKQIFYYRNNNEIVFGSEINYILEYLNNNNVSYNLDQNGAYFLLTYGYMLENYTLFKEIKKLNAGNYIKIKNNKVKIKQYHKINNTPNNNQGKDEIIENIDYLFRKAIELEFDKDKEYDYKHIAGLSGGLDSRMTNWVAHDMGYKNILNYTYSQTNYLDEKIAKKIATDLNHEFIFKALDNGTSLKDIEKTIKITKGLVLYYGPAQVNDFIDLFNFKNYGLVHTGQVGGIIKGFYNNNDKLKYGGYFSSKLLNKLNYQILNKYDNEGKFILKNRQFNGTLQGNLPMQLKTETVSPFLNKDLIDYCLKIPNSYDQNELFFKWMLKKYPKSTKYKWDHLNAKITDPIINIMGRSVSIKKLPKKISNKILRMIGLKKSAMNSKNHMNPMDYWYNNNENINNFFNNYFKNNINRLDKYKDLKNDCIYLYQEGNTREKTQVLTLLATLKLYF